MKFLGAISVLAAVRFANAQAPIYGQCGGQGWTGATTCASGSVCTVSNQYYSQCLPGSAPAPSSSSSTRSSGGSGTPTTSASSGSSTNLSGLPRLGGVNTAGYDFSAKTDGSFVYQVQPPPVSQFSHFANEGANLFRIPFAWSEMQPTLGGSLNQTFLSQYDATVQSALATGAYVIIDVHNYARLNGGIIGQGGPTNAQFANLWTQLAQKYSSNQKIIFGIVNEPHDVDVPLWVATVQATVNAIRAAGAKNFLLLPGSSWASAEAFPTEAGPALVKVTDPLGGTSKLLFDVHKYLDSDNSGTHTECVTNNVAVLTTLVNFLKANGNRQAILSETGGGETSSCITALGQQLAYVKNAYPTLLGFAIWGAGSFDLSYELSISPLSNGQDQPLVTQAIAPYFP